MTERELNQYVALKQRLERNEKKLIELREKEIPTICGKVKGSSKHFPFIETHTSVEMYEPREYGINLIKIKEVETDIEADRRRVGDIECYINSIKDPMLQTIFEMKGV